MPHPREFDHHFLPQGRELDKKIARVAGIRSLKKIFPGLPGGGGGGCTQLELTETLLFCLESVTRSIKTLSIRQATKSERIYEEFLQSFPSFPLLIILCSESAEKRVKTVAKKANN